MATDSGVDGRRSDAAGGNGGANDGDAAGDRDGANDGDAAGAALDAEPDADGFDADASDAARADGTSGERPDGPEDAPLEAVDAGRDSDGATTTARVCGQLIDLGTLPGDTTSKAVAVNDLGQVVGLSVSADDAGQQISRVFRWESGTMVLVRTDPVAFLGGFRDPAPQVTAINHTGQMAGSQVALFFGQVPNAAVVWDSPNRGARQLAGGYGSGAPNAIINDAGQVIGAAQVCTDTTVCNGVPKRIHAFFWNSEAAAGVDVGTLGGAAVPGGSVQVVETSLVALNQAGQAAGWSLAPDGTRHAALWSGSTLKDLGTLGGPTSTAYTLDETGAVFGTSLTAGGQTDVFRWAPGGMTDLGALPAGNTRIAINRAGDAIGQSPTDGYFWKAGATTNLAMTVAALNDLGQVVGVNGAKHLVVWRDGATTDLGSLGGTSITPTAIDNLGQIVGAALTATGAQHGFLFQPSVCAN